MQGVTIALTDGAAHSVDSNEMAFKLASQYAFRQAYMKAGPVILEPQMNVEVGTAAAAIPTCQAPFHLHFPIFMSLNQTYCILTSRFAPRRSSRAQSLGI